MLPLFFVKLWLIFGEFLVYLFLWNHWPEIIHILWLTKSLLYWKQVICYKLECADHSATVLFIIVHCLNTQAQYATIGLIDIHVGSSIQHSPIHTQYLCSSWYLHYVIIISYIQTPDFQTKHNILYLSIINSLTPVEIFLARPVSKETSHPFISPRQWLHHVHRILWANGVLLSVMRFQQN